MLSTSVVIQGVGLVTSVGLTAPSSCAAIRAKISNPTETRFMVGDGEWLVAHQVPLTQAWCGLTRLAKMASMAIEEALEDLPRVQWELLPLLLCVAEDGRPGRMIGLDDQLLLMIQEELGVRFAAHSMVIKQGRSGVAVALAQARILMAQSHCNRVLVAAVDSLLTWPTLSTYSKQKRLLADGQSNGFMAGEGAGALLVDQTVSCRGLRIEGFGFGREIATIDSQEPLRGDGLSKTIQAAMADAGVDPHDVDFRITDLAGEHYYFKEASLAMSRTLRRTREAFDLWHPAESIGEAGSLVGIVCLVVGQAATRKGYAPGPRALFHFSNDDGVRAAIVASMG
jgi:3-oxoacyl-[acyl-carrier-protein] synthase-1